MKLFITGASSGIGRAVAVEAAKRGARCVLAARRADELEKTRRMMERADEQVVREVDFADHDGIELELMRIFTEEGPFDGVVYCAGVCPVTPLARLDLAALEETMRVNCGGFVATMRAFAAKGAHAEKAWSVAVSSVSATTGWAGGTAYCASKGALSAAARALAVELAPKGIKVTAIEPEYVLTDMFRRGAGRMGVPESKAESPETVAARLLDGMTS